MRILSMTILKGSPLPSAMDPVCFLVGQDLLGRGAFASVYAVVNKQSQTHHAMKEISDKPCYTGLTLLGFGIIKGPRLSAV